MAIADKYIDEVCKEEWIGLICPHGVNHEKTQVCISCLEYAMLGE